MKITIHVVAFMLIILCAFSAGTGMGALLALSERDTICSEYLP